MALVGDSLLEPFWPTGTGCARGFFGGLDACWLMRQMSLGKMTAVEAVAERESIYRVLSGTTPENTCKDYAAYNVDPHTRYPTLNTRLILPAQVIKLTCQKSGFIFGHLAWDPHFDNVTRRHGYWGSGGFCKWQRGGATFYRFVFQEK